MDNITHGLIGFAVAKIAADRANATEAKTRAMIWGAVLASNLPDLDFLIGLFGSDRKLTYLLHHRGHTHTLVWVLPLSLLAAWLGVKAARFVPERKEWASLVFVSGTAGLLHIVFDSFNNYGVHAYYPFDDRWYYGDVLFIIEPWLFGPLLGFLAFSGRSSWARPLAAVLGALVLALVWFIRELAAVNAAIATAWIFVAALLQALAARKGPRLAGYAVVSGVLATLLAFTVGGRVAIARARASLAAVQPPLPVLDISRTPTPGNPFCWNVLVAERDAVEFRVHRGVVTLSAWFSSSVCRFRAPEAPTATLAPSRLSNGTPAEGVSFDAVYVGRLDQLRKLNEKQCRARAFLQFARMPFWSSFGPGRPDAILGDLRYDNSHALGFSEIVVGSEGTEACPFWVPPWRPPRADLLEQASVAE